MLLRIHMKIMTHLKRKHEEGHIQVGGGISRRGSAVVMAGSGGWGRATL